ncbi:DUF1351 domain-containing protein [Sporomusa sphaeroides DSM 2875]|uniref:DUF1351 domain-containing protein n=1 Tax=Sporomusa sphaeroides TaxID=47679 RepID=UPI002030C1B0|nr:DUF1351 domain-containing protein [Sporomusa sphaeroides]MCM0758072.1 DUF1351 domain-containing protein [Sporomusa sphaeroides DSM 2875]
MLKDTGELIQKMVDSATAAGLKIPEPVTETDESVTETVDIVPENTDSVTLPAEVEIEPKTLTLSQQFSWNFDELKAVLADRIKKYTGLVVNDKNLKSMERTQKEIAGLRTKIAKFKLEVKKELEKPYQEFEVQIKELLDLVASVEKPIMDQIEKYEAERKNRERAKLQGLINSTATKCGLNEKYSSQIVIDEKWLNRTAKPKEVTEAIQTRVAWYLDIQAQEHQAALFKAQKIEMAKLLCLSLSAGLATPLTFEEIESRVDGMTDILAVKSFIEEEVARRKERENRASQAAIEQAERERLAALPPEPPTDYGTSHEWHDVEVPLPMPPVLPVMPAPPVIPIMPPLPPIAPVVQKWAVVLRLPAITVDQAKGFKEYLTASGIAYEIVSQEMVR